jgi:hypothetical protein
MASDLIPSRRFTSARCRILAGLLLLVHAAVAGFAWFTPNFAATVVNSSIEPELGRAYSLRIPFGPSRLYMLQPDSNGAQLSQLLLLEDGHRLGPAHALHDGIRKQGGGRYSHWGDSVIFSAVDGSDPRTNGRSYSVEAPEIVKPRLRIAVLIVLSLADIAFALIFRQELAALLRRRSGTILLVLAIASAAAAALFASGVPGTLTVAAGGAPQDAALCLEAVQHACLGCLLAIGIWAGGAGVTRLLHRSANPSLAEVLIPAFPVSLVLLAGLLATALLAPHGGVLALILWAACWVPLVRWRPGRQDLANVLKACVVIIPFAIAFGIWLALFWHGPTATLPGSPTGDLTDYAGTIWTLDKQPYPSLNLGYENGVARIYFNILYPALGAALLHLPGFDPLLYLSAGGGTSYVFFSATMLHVYLTDRPARPASRFSVVLLLLAFIVGARYPYWVIESIPVVFLPALTISVFWMTKRSRTSFGWIIAAMVGGLVGSMLSKVVTAIVLVPLGAAEVSRQFRQFPKPVQVLAIVIGTIFAAYCAAMLWRFMPIFIAAAQFGPESLRNPPWWFLWRDAGTAALAVLVWFITEVPVALALFLGLASFLGFSFLFQANFVCATLIVGLLTFDRPLKLGLRWLVLLALALALPAALTSDPTGTATGIAWTVCLGGSVLAAVLCTVPIEGNTSLLPFRVVASTAAATIAIAGLLLVGAANGHIIFNSGWTPLKPELRDVWAEVRHLTPTDALIFTDQVDDTINVVGGWNTYAYSGQRQLYLSSYYTAFDLRSDPSKLQDVLAVNEAVLSGARKPADVPTRLHYATMFAVVSVSRTVPLQWTKIYNNADYAIFRMTP